MDISDLQKVAFRDQLKPDSAFVEYFSDFSGDYAEFGKAALDHVLKNRQTVKDGKGRAAVKAMVLAGKISPSRFAEASLELASRLAWS
jgi:hypothetical protein